jgi:hypothetical protein
MRGRALLAQKIAAIENCAAAGLGVVLVPVVVPGINADNLGEILDFALRRQPVVRGVHFQPVSYFGRYPAPPTDADRITLPEIMAGIEDQSGGRVRVENFRPAGAENALCSFNGTFVSMPDGRLFPLTRPRATTSCCSSTEPVAPKAGSCCAEAETVAPLEASRCSETAPVDGSARARDFVARSWAAPEVREPVAPLPGPSFGEWDVFLARARTHALTISGMAFQDAWTLDLDRLRDCHIHITDPDGATIPFCAYNLTGTDGSGPYRPERPVGK